MILRQYVLMGSYIYGSLLVLYILQETLTVNDKLCHGFCYWLLISL